MLLPPFEYFEPASVREALELKKQHGENARFLAGGTDLLVHLKKKLITTDVVIDLGKIPELKQITVEGDTCFIGACTTMSRLSGDTTIQKHFPALKQGADNMGTHLVRNRASLGGNSCNASPAADTPPALLVYDAVVLLESLDGKREVPVKDFYLAPGKSAIGPEELMLGFRLPVPPANSGSQYIQLGKRKSSEINVVGVASYLEVNPSSGNVENARIALCAVAPTPVRAPEAEAAVIGQKAEEDLFYAAGEKARHEDARPIDDFRGTADYRRAMIGVLTKRTLANAFEQAKG